MPPKALHDSYKSLLEGVGFNFNANENCSHPVVITNEIYNCLLHLFNLAERKNAILKLLGEVHRQNEEDLFTKNHFFYFDKKFSALRIYHSRKKTLSDFNSLPVDLSQLNYYPSTSPSFAVPPVLPRMAPTSVRREKCAPEKVVKLIESVNLQRRVKRLKKSVRNARTTLKSVQTEQYQLNSLKDKNLKLNNKVTKLQEQTVNLNYRIQGLEDQLTIALDEVESLKKQQTEQSINNVFCLKEQGSFTSKANLAFGELSVRCGIAQEKIGLAILIICNLLGIVLDAVPSRRTVGRSLFAVSYISCQQIQDFLEGAQNITLMSDETRKFVHKFQTYIAAARDKLTGKDILTHLGVFEVPTKAALRSFQELETVIKGIAETVGIASSPFWEQFIISIKNVMGDKAATQISFNNILMKCRAAFLQACPNFSQLSDSLKEQALRVNSLFCLLHVIHNLTKVLVNVLLQHERQVTENPALKQSSVEFLITEISRHFGSRASGRYKTAGYWTEMAEKKKWDNSTICNLVGHRFNILLFRP